MKFTSLGEGTNQVSMQARFILQIFYSTRYFIKFELIEAHHFFFLLQYYIYIKDSPQDGLVPLFCVTLVCACTCFHVPMIDNSAAFCHGRLTLRAFIKHYIKNKIFAHGYDCLKFTFAIIFIVIIYCKVIIYVYEGF